MLATGEALTLEGYELTTRWSCLPSGPWITSSSQLDRMILYGWVSMPRYTRSRNFLTLRSSF